MATQKTNQQKAGKAVLANDLKEALELGKQIGALEVYRNLQEQQEYEREEELAIARRNQRNSNLYYFGICIGVIIGFSIAKSLYKGY